MKVWQLQNQFGLKNLKLTERSQSSIGPSDVLIKVHACSLNFRDLMVVKGQYNPKQPLPLVPLSDGAGEIVEVGEKVKHFKIGDKVCATFSQDWDHGTATDQTYKSTLGSPIDGMLTEFITLNEKGVIKFPEHLNYSEAATLPCAAVTAFNAIFMQSPPFPGQSILIEGMGGVSVFALQFAKVLGLNSIVTSSSQQKLERAKELGASHCINYRENSSWEKEVLTITNNEGVDKVIEVGGADTLPKAMTCTKRGGLINLIGILSGMENKINLIPILMNNLRIQGIFVGAKTVFSAMNQVVSHSKLRPVIDKEFSFDQANEAFTHLESGKHFGKIVIKVH